MKEALLGAEINTVNCKLVVLEVDSMRNVLAIIDNGVDDILWKDVVVVKDCIPVVAQLLLVSFTHICHRTTTWIVEFNVFVTLLQAAVLL